MRKLPSPLLDDPPPKTKASPTRRNRKRSKPAPIGIKPFVLPTDWDKNQQAARVVPKCQELGLPLSQQNYVKALLWPVQPRSWADLTPELRAGLPLWFYDLPTNVDLLNLELAESLVKNNGFTLEEAWQHLRDQGIC